MPSFQNRVGTSDSRITESLLCDDNVSCNTCERRCEHMVVQLRMRVVLQEVPQQSTRE